MRSATARSSASGGAAAARQRRPRSLPGRKTAAPQPRAAAVHPGRELQGGVPTAMTRPPRPRPTLRTSAGFTAPAAAPLEHRPCTCASSPASTGRGSDRYQVERQLETATLTQWQAPEKRHISGVVGCVSGPGPARHRSVARFRALDESAEQRTVESGRSGKARTAHHQDGPVVLVPPGPSQPSACGLGSPKE